MDPRTEPTWLERFLFTTTLGNAILAWLEHRHGLAVVDADRLGRTRLDAWPVDLHLDDPALAPAMSWEGGTGGH